MARKMIIKGVGSFMAKRLASDGGTEVITLGTLQNLKIDLNVEIEDIFGGDGLFAIDTLVKSKSVEITATDAKFDLAALQLMMGSNITDGKDDYVWVLNEQHVVSAVGIAEVSEITVNDGAISDGNITITLNGVGTPVLVEAGDSAEAVASKIGTVISVLPGYTATVSGAEVTITANVAGDQIDATFADTDSTGVTATVSITTQGSSASGGMVKPNFADTVYTDTEFSVRLKDSNKLLTQVFTNNPSADEFYWDATNENIVLHSSLAGKDIILQYKRSEKVDVADLLADEVPFTVAVVHHGSFLQKDGSYQGIETELYACRAKGTFTIDAQRASASASQVTLVLVDPERADGKIGTIKRYSSTTRV